MPLMRSIIENGTGGDVSAPYSWQGGSGALFVEITGTATVTIEAAHSDSGPWLALEGGGVSESRVVGFTLPPCEIRVRISGAGSQVSVFVSPVDLARSGRL